MGQLHSHRHEWGGGLVEESSSSTPAISQTLTLSASNCRFECPDGYSGQYERDGDPLDMEPSCDIQLRFTQHPSLTTTVNGITYPVYMSDTQRTYKVYLNEWTPIFTNNSTGVQLQDGDVIQANEQVLYIFATYGVDIDDWEGVMAEGGMWAMTDNTANISNSIEGALRSEAHYPYITNNNENVPDISGFVNREFTYLYDYYDFSSEIGDAVSMRLTYSEEITQNQNSGQQSQESTSSSSGSDSSNSTSSVPNSPQLNITFSGSGYRYDASSVPMTIHEGTFTPYIVDGVSQTLTKHEYINGEWVQNTYPIYSGQFTIDETVEEEYYDEQNDSWGWRDVTNTTTKTLYLAPLNNDYYNYYWEELHGEGNYEGEDTYHWGIIEGVPHDNSNGDYAIVFIGASNYTVPPLSSTNQGIDTMDHSFSYINFTVTEQQ